jgi:hypothetical protein
MSSHEQSSSPPPLDLSAWRSVPTLLMVVGGIGALAGWIMDSNQFGFSWLLAFMFFLSICLGSLALVMLHHLFDASWSVVIRRICEQIAFLLPVMMVLFIPIAILAPKMYPWMHMVEAHAEDHSLKAKYPLFSFGGYYAVVVICFAVWSVLSYKLRYWSLKQDETGSVLCTRRMRQYAAAGIFLFGLTLTLAAIMWMKALFHEWFSTMYGVWYFAASMWTTMFTIYFLTVLLKRQGPLREVATDKTFYFIGSLMFAFTVFYAYITFFQYFIIWNANMPEETFWYTLREQGSWWYVGMIIIFGHFFLPFLTLLRIDVKVKYQWIMLSLGVWAWLMNFFDMSFNIMPVKHPEGFVLHWMDIACMMFIGGLLAKIFLKRLYSSPIVPQKDPRFAEAMDIYVAPESQMGAAKTGGGH